MPPNRAPNPGASLHHAAIFVENLDRAAAFYRDLLGLTVTGGEHLPAPPIEMVFLSAGERHHDLVIARRLDGVVGGVDKAELFHLAFALPAAASFDAFVEHVHRLAVPVVAGPQVHPVAADGRGGRRAIYLSDPDGYLLEITQDITPAPQPETTPWPLPATN